MDVKSIILNIINRKIYNRFCSKLLSPTPDKTILDVGCGLNLFHRHAIGVDKFVDDEKILPYSADKISYESGTIDSIFSAHCLEHCANPIKVLKEWFRILKLDGDILLILPHGGRTFDYGRSLTELEHLISDYQHDVDESDRTHWCEFRDKTILGGHPKIPNRYVLEAKNDNFNFFQQYGLIHHHVWTEIEVVELLSYIGFRVEASGAYCPGRDDSLFVYAKKSINSI